jgi:hypothetical protein
MAPQTFNRVIDTGEKVAHLVIQTFRIRRQLPSNHAGLKLDNSKTLTQLIVQLSRDPETLFLFRGEHLVGRELHPSILAGSQRVWRFPPVHIPMQVRT